MRALGQRKGKIVLGQGFMDSLTQEDLSKLFTNFFPISIQSEWFSLGENLVYYGVSRFFDEIEKGTPIPEYLIEIQGSQDVAWEAALVEGNLQPHLISGLRFIKLDKSEPHEVKREHKLLL